MQEYAKAFYKSKAWQRCREAYTRKAGGLCERCMAQGQIVPGEIVHHKIHLTPENINNSEITMNFNNLEFLCRNCHGKKHSKHLKRFKVDDLGRVLICE